jgi:hypothetical protein
MVYVVKYMMVCISIIAGPRPVWRGWDNDRIKSMLKNETFRRPLPRWEVAERGDELAHDGLRRHHQERPWRLLGSDPT